MYSWQSIISHVPQTIFLLDSSFIANIAFGEDLDKVDYQRLYKVCDQAEILDFIEKSPSGFNTCIGERGVRLSGGQRQRLGIARALYKDLRYWYLDEATSALDHQTEAKIIDSIRNIDDKITIFSIAHRLSSLKHADRIIELKKFKICRELSYKDIQDL